MKVQKKWNELTDKEKIEYLKMDSEDTMWHEWRFMLTLLTLVLVAITLFHIAMLKVQVADLYTQLNVTASANTTAMVDDTYKEIGNLSLPTNIAFGALIVLMIVGAGWRYFKWKKFRKSIRRDANGIRDYL